MPLAEQPLEVARADRLRVRTGPNYIVRADAPVQGKVAIFSGGSGHEPMHGGFVGMGMLDAGLRRAERRHPDAAAGRPAALRRERGWSRRARLSPAWRARVHGRSCGLRHDEETHGKVWRGA
ncbi:MAG: dihydroxyacetone kinase subunit DhaK [Actinobacteria bacterium]|nr:dihydroxyacetone kinase subunit DhaK [Actinomycetota bacterium]